MGLWTQPCMLGPCLGNTLKAGEGRKGGVKEAAGREGRTRRFRGGGKDPLHPGVYLRAVSLRSCSYRFYCFHVNTECKQLSYLVYI